MLFFKNLIRKNKIQNYIFTLVGLLFILLSLELTFFFLNNKYDAIENSKENRSLIISSEEDCELFEKYDLESCSSSNETTTIVLVNKQLKEKFIKEYEEQYTIMTFSQQDDNLVNIIKALKVLCVIMIIALIVIVIIIQYIFVVEEKKVCEVLHSIGYSTNRILIKNVGALNIFYMIIEAIVTILFLAIYLIFSQYLLNLNIAECLIITYLVLMIVVDIVYIIEFKYISMKK